MTPHTTQHSAKADAPGRARLVRAVTLWVWIMLMASVGGAVTYAALPAPRASADINEYEVKAAFIFNFAKYASWPKGTFPKKDSPIIIAVVGKDPFGKKLEAVIAGRKIQGRPVVVRRYAKASDIKDAHLAILGKLSTAEQKAAVVKLKKAKALIVADEGGTEKSGASLGFLVEKSKIRFEVHAKNLKASKIRLGSQLLKLAKIVGRK